MDSFSEEPKVELEDQFILRLPLTEAEIVRNALKKKSKKFKKLLKIELGDDLRSGTVYVQKKPLYAALFDLPTVTESYKLIDNVNLYKTADICQLVLCSEEPIELTENTSFKLNSTGLKSKIYADRAASEKKKYSYSHGSTPPMKNVRKFRFRKTLRNKNDVQETADIEKEVLMLLRMDNEAISTRYEFYYERDKYDLKSNKECEKSIFGDLSDSEGSSKKSSSSELEDNDIMDFTR